MAEKRCLTNVDVYETYVKVFKADAKIIQRICDTTGKI